MSTRVLFILKRREDYSAALHYPGGLSTGLFHSATFVKDMLRLHGVHASLVVVTDNNDIDREVTRYKPTHVVVEGLWVVPEKFDVLKILHPAVTWVVRLHSDIPFMSMEGMAMEWLIEYLRRGLTLAFNSNRILLEFLVYARAVLGRQLDLRRVVFLPNYYPKDLKPGHRKPPGKIIDISCFGAIRPLKNTLMQAMAALDFAVREDRLLRFHINSGRVEGGGAPIMRNIVDMFAELEGSGHTLVTHEWTPREQFLKLCASMDLGMQVSFSETFNIVAADHVSQGVPVVGSDIPWLSVDVTADPVSSGDIQRAMRHAFSHAPNGVSIEQRNLIMYDHDSVRAWLHYLSL